MKIKSTLLIAVLLGFNHTISAEQPKSQYLSKKNAPMNAKSIRATSISKKWMDRNIMPFADHNNGAVMFTYGRTRPTIICKPLHVCTIMLQKGERIIDSHSGDTGQWIIVPSKPSEGVPPHVIVKPIDSNLITNLSIITDRRTYVIELKSRRDRHQPLTAFLYPDDERAAWKYYYDAMNQQRSEASARNKAKQAEINKENQLRVGSNDFDARNLDFKYEILGNASWKPIRVFNDGRKTYIQMPKSMEVSEAPILLSLDNKTTGLVNYRLDNDTFIVDRLFRQATLITGVGKNQTRIIIRKHNGKGGKAYEFSTSING